MSSSSADRYQALVSKVEAANTVGDNKDLAIAVARYYAKIMAYKDEYEVARLYSDPAFKEKLQAQFEGDVKLVFNLAPPLISRKDPVSGHLRKREFGAWMLPAFKMLAALKGLRGTALDIFGYSAERKMERQFISDYAAMIESLLPELTAENYSYAVQLAELPEQVRGYGHVKERTMADAMQSKASLLASFKNPPPQADFVEVKMVG